MTFEQMAQSVYLAVDHDGEIYNAIIAPCISSVVRDKGRGINSRISPSLVFTPVRNTISRLGLIQRLDGHSHHDLITCVSDAIVSYYNAEISLGNYNKRTP